MNFFKRKKEITHVIERSNVIQFDEMGYPLRLCIMSDRKQRWIYTDEREGDVVLKWEEQR
ncbi:hypothetical protein GTI81_02950 [Enterococcus faecalis]|uniref:Uncharacterized protein n=1 Tax=Enterococcus faecalis TaxID=1351 RepID=A0AAP6RG04_ENTFL|nr:hypothetical protein [Enterococcus faecalis]MCL4595488.1 hypothetical protein [Enterococcus faecalis]MXS29557.1 hypothetical protein [Enterococcus faecalis]MXS51686.1 hypothetical protein [Enterococcus faecalis]